MPQYRVGITQTVSSSVLVEAESPEAAASEFYNSPDMPGSITVGAFGSYCNVDEAGEWEASEVLDAKGNIVWTGGA
jgi:hypothetical protein